MPARGVKSSVAASKQEALVREILEGVADKMDGFVIEALEGKSAGVGSPGSASALAMSVKKVLTKTLRRLERDDLLTRRVHAAARRLQADAARREPGTLRLQRVDVAGSTHAGCGTVQTRLRDLCRTSIELAPEPDAEGAPVIVDA